MTQQEREKQVNLMVEKATSLWQSMRAIEVEGARSGNICMDGELLRRWTSQVFAIMAGIGPLAWPLKDEHEAARKLTH